MAYRQHLDRLEISRNTVAFRKLNKVFSWGWTCEGYMYAFLGLKGEIAITFALTTG